MKTLRWKPLKSSVQQARALTGILETLNLLMLGLWVLIAFLGLFSGNLILAFFCIPIGLISFLIFKMAYIVLELLTEIADDTRLQLMALAGDEYDQIQAVQDDDSAESSLSKDDLKTVLIYEAAVKGYKKIGGRASTYDNSIIVSEEKVVLRDSSGNTVMTMVLYDGEWIRE